MSVSVALASFNGAQFVGAQVASILDCLSSGDELVVSDDGSTDGTVSIIETIARADSRVKLLCGPRKGIVENFGHALSHCTGDVIFLADQDDVWLEDKVTVVLRYFRDPDVMCVTHDVAVVRPDLTVLHPSYFELRDCGEGLLKNWVKVTYLGAAMAFRASLLSDVLPMPQRIPMHDQWIGAIAELRGKSIFLPEVMGLYRRHGGNATQLNRPGSVSSVARKRVISAWLLSRKAIQIKLIHRQNFNRLGLFREPEHLGDD